MQREWSSFRITLLLYIVVLILPLSFYFVHSSFKTMQKDTQIVRQSSWLAGALGHHTNDGKTIQSIDTTLNDVSIWENENSDTKLYIGAQSLSKDLSEVRSCWDRYKTSANTQCYTLADNMALNIEKMVYLKQKKIINIFYLSLTLAMIFMLLLIYLVRTYIHIQMKKHAIHDHETTLFNKKYFLAEFKSTSARAVRHEYALSLLQIEIEGFEEDTKLQTLKAFGALLHTLVRDGDLPARYDEKHFLILLPFTDKENALLFENRTREAIMQDNSIVSENIKLNFTITEFDKEESEEAFIQRSLTT